MQVTKLDSRSNLSFSSAVHGCVGVEIAALYGVYNVVHLCTLLLVHSCDVHYYESYTIVYDKVATAARPTRYHWASVALWYFF